MKFKILTASLFCLIVLQACSKDDTPEDSKNKIANLQVTGSSANDILSDTNYKSILIELVYVEGFEPTTTAIDNLKSFINSTSFKPDGITVETRSIPSLGNTVYSLDDIANIEAANRTKFNSGSQIAIWAFFTDGKSDKDADNTVVLGTAYRNTSFVIFEETVRKSSNSPLKPSRALLESTVIDHEFGHLLGLTNFGSDMQSPHEDPDHERHCNVQNCLMYWEAVATSGFTNIMNRNTPPGLDAQCLADLKANGGR